MKPPPPVTSARTAVSLVVRLRAAACRPEVHFLEEMGGHGLEEEPAELGIPDHETAEKAPRLLEHPEEPFEARPLDEPWGPANEAGEDVDAAPYPHDERDAELLQVVGGPVLLLGRRQGEKQHVGRR